MNYCAGCKSPLNDSAKFCTKCGLPISSHENYCENPSCIRCQTHFLFEENIRTCDECGQDTTFGKKINNLL